LKAGLKTGLYERGYDDEGGATVGTDEVGR
jgi:hypothetical protein